MTYNPSIGDGAQLMDIMQIQATLAGYSLVDPDGVTVETGGDPLTIDVEFDTEARLGGGPEEVDDETDLELPDPDPDDPLKVLVYVDEDAEVQAISGEPASDDPEGESRTGTINPQLPIPNEPFLPIAEVWLDADASDISEGDISSRRVPYTLDYAALENVPERATDTEYTYNPDRGWTSLIDVSVQDETVEEEYWWEDGNVPPEEVDVHIYTQADSSYGSMDAEWEVEIYNLDGDVIWEDEGDYSTGSIGDNETVTHAEETLEFGIDEDEFFGGADVWATEHESWRPELVIEIDGYFAEVPYHTHNEGSQFERGPHGIDS